MPNALTASFFRPLAMGKAQRRFRLGHDDSMGPQRTQDTRMFVRRGERDDAGTSDVLERNDGERARLNIGFN